MSKDYNKVIDIYNKLPKSQQLMVAPNGTFVDSPKLLDRYILYKQKGFIEAYKTDNPEEAFVTLAVDPQHRGKGLGKQLINEELQRLSKKGIKNILYKINNKNIPSKRTIEYFSGNPVEYGEDYSIYKIPTISNKDATKDKFYNPIIQEVLQAYADNGYDLSDTKFTLGYIPKYNDGSLAYNFKLPSGGSYIQSTGSVELNPDILNVMRNYNIKDITKEQFAKQLIAHELAHKVDDKYLSDNNRNDIINEANNNKFSTIYLNMVDNKYRNKELLAEYLSNKILNKTAMYKQAGMVMPYQAATGPSGAAPHEQGGKYGQERIKSLGGFKGINNAIIGLADLGFTAYTTPYGLANIGKYAWKGVNKGVKKFGELLYPRPGAAKPLQQLNKRYMHTAKLTKSSPYYDEAYAAAHKDPTFWGLQARMQKRVHKKMLPVYDALLTVEGLEDLYARYNNLNKKYNFHSSGTTSGRNPKHKYPSGSIHKFKPIHIPN